MDLKLKIKDLENKLKAEKEKLDCDLNLCKAISILKSRVEKELIQQIMEDLDK